MTRLQTTTDLLKMPDDAWQYELWRGEIVRTPPGGGASSERGTRAVARLMVVVEPRGLGSVSGADGGFMIIQGDVETTVAPDAAFVRADRLPDAETRERILRLVLDLAVEVISPSHRPGTVQRKMDLYLSSGIPLLWIVRPRAGNVTVYEQGAEPRTVNAGEMLDGGEVLPGFTVPADDLLR